MMCICAPGDGGRPQTRGCPRPRRALVEGSVETPAVPNNYVEPWFLEELRRNGDISSSGYQLSCVALFITLWLYMEQVGYWTHLYSLE